MSNEIAKVENQVAEVKQNYITAMLNSAKQRFMEVNAGLDLDFVRMGEFLKLSKKGNFVLRSDETVSFGDVLDVVIAAGEKRYMLWGRRDTPEQDELIAAGNTLEEAVAELNTYIALRPDASERYSNDDIQLRYLAYVVPTSTLNGEDMPDVYLLSLAPGDTIAFAGYSKSVFRGDKNKGIPKMSGLSSVVTRIETEERKNKNNESYLGVRFSVVGKFEPSDYNITE